MPTIGPFKFSGGLNTKASKMTMPKDSLADAQNVEFSYGDLQKRAGSVVLNSSAIAAAAITGLTDWQTAAGQRYLVGTCGTKVAKMEDLDGTFDDVTGAITITAGNNNTHTFAGLNNILAFGNGVDNTHKWTGTGNAADLGGSPPKGSILLTANNFLFISGNTTTPSRVYYSNVLDPETWGATSYVDFRGNDGDKVTALASINQNVVIFKRRSIGQLWTNTLSLTGAATLGPLSPLRVGIGCVGSLALDNIDDGTICFLGSNAHVYMLDGSSIVDISDPESPYSNIQPSLDVLPAARLPYAVLRFYPTRKQVWLAISSAGNTTNNIVFVYDLILKIWTKFTGIAANAMVSSIDTRTTPTHDIVMLTGNYTGKVYEQDRGSSNGEDTSGMIDGWATQCILLGSDQTDFIPRCIVSFIETQNSTNIEYNYGFNGFTDVNRSILVNQDSGAGRLDQFTLDVDVLGGSATIRKVVALDSDGRCDAVQIQFRNRNSGQDFIVHPYYISDEIVV